MSETAPAPEPAEPAAVHDPYALLGPALIAITALLLTGWTWQTWADVVVDFGRELYVPWQLSQGQVLYRDVAYFSGPLSAYWNTLVFHVLGDSVRSLTLVNLVGIATLLALLYHLLTRVSDRVSATAVCLMVACVFCFGQQRQIANFNWVAPYSHEITHGVLLSLASVAAFSRYTRSGATRWAAATGAALGLVFLTKPEVFLAASAGVGAGWGTLWRTQPERRSARDGGVLVGAALAPAAVAFGLLCLALPAGQALRGTLGGWVYVFDRRISGLLFYTQAMGTADVVANLGRVAWWAALYGAALLPALAAGLHLKGKQGRQAAIVVGGAVLTLGAVAIQRSPETMIHWKHCAAPLFLTTLGLVAALVWRLLPKRTTPTAPASPALPLAAALVTFALVLLAKIFLNVRSGQYGFALTLPAAAVTAVAVCSWVPAWIDRRGGTGWILRAAGLTLLVVVSAAHLVTSHYHFTQRTHWVGEGPDAMVADVRGGPINSMLDELALRVQPQDTLAVLPEGVSLNFFLRRQTSVPFVNYMPPEVLMFGDQRILAAFQEQ
ncbi:glycosyltransferase family 39 protein, partial [Planctomycetota bacterium]|nr:glycosyltransferase family 39 protein [Planctomycetota bacterium]